MNFITKLYKPVNEYLTISVFTLLRGGDLSQRGEVEKSIRVLWVSEKPLSDLNDLPLIKKINLMTCLSSTKVELKLVIL